jgi:hypothetical protein
LGAWKEIEMLVYRRKQGEWVASVSVRSFKGAWINVGSKRSNPISAVIAAILAAYAQL